MDQVAIWITAVGTLLTGLSALAVFWQLRQAHRSEVLEQANRITWWLEPAPKDDKGTRVRVFADAASFQGGDYPNLPHAALFILNGSDNCVYEGSLQLPESFDPGDGKEERFIWRQIGVIPPGPPAEFRVPISVSAHSSPTASLRRKADLPFNRHVEWVEFRDRNNKVWRRFGDGTLKPQPDRPPETETAYSP
jgi:hypothetical protein